MLITLKKMTGVTQATFSSSKGINYSMIFDGFIEKKKYLRNYIVQTSYINMLLQMGEMDLKLSSVNHFWISKHGDLNL